MKVKILIFILSTVLALPLLSGCQAKVKNPLGDSCATKYPIVFVHGFMYRDDVGVMDYWGTIPDALRKEGAVVYFGNLKAVCSNEENAEILKKSINDVLKRTGAEKVNIIAHSKGGLESRYMISKLGMGDKVASLTTISTPHHGTGIADALIKTIPVKNKPAMALFDMYAVFIGDHNPDANAAVRGLSSEYMNKFNNEVVNVPGVYYQSYGSKLSKECPNLLWRTLYNQLLTTDGENDGLVSVESSKWGVFKGIANDEGNYSYVSHVDIIGMNRVSSGCFDADPFYKKMVHELKMKGF